jgi:GNAT superfamily N-acetyltransferase
VIRKAILEDMGQIMDILGKTKVEMHIYNNFQWDESYPTRVDFIEDIKKENLYCIEIEQKLAGFICVNTVEPIEYKGLKWSSTNAAMIIHRMSVNSVFRQRGIGVKLIKFAEQLANKNNIRYLKTDTYSLNVKMNNLLSKCSYNFIGEISFPQKEKPFNCYDIII